jgi:hypothetical protein
MARVKLEPEEAKRRTLESKRKYRETHAEELKEKRRMTVNDDMRAKWREDNRRKIDKLIEAGVYQKLQPGRKRLYTEDEAKEVARKQRQESYLRRKERFEAGVFHKLQPGRKRLYTEDEAKEVARKQRQECYWRRKERIEAAKALIAQAQP